MAGPGTDFLSFIGNTQQVTLTLVNPYSGETISVNEVKHVNTTTYDGGGGDDFLFMTNNGDVLFLVDESGDIVIESVETFIAGEGGDIINLAHSTITYNDTLINGGNGNDIIWGNVGQDHILGKGGDDIINGGPGNDTLEGEEGNDEIRGGEGDDYIAGGDGNDLLFGANGFGLPEVKDKDFVDDVIFPELSSGVDVRDSGPVASLGINNNNLTADFDAQISLTFRDGFAGYNNTLGIYRVAEDGTMEAAQILYTNVKDVGINTAQIIDLPLLEDGGEFAFFIIANGDRVNGEYAGLDNITDPGAVRFVYDFGGPNERAATVDDNGGDITIVYDDGVTVEALSGPHYHTTERDGTPNLNWDGETHALSGLVDPDNSDVMRIGFEDLPNLGDADFEDVLFDIDIIEVVVDNSETGNDTLLGGAGTDALYGAAGNDILVGGEGEDVLFGGADSDIFLFQTLDGSVDTIKDFEAGVGGDVINITDVLQGFDPLTDALTDFVRLVNSSGNTEVQVDADGAGGDFVAIAMIEGGVNDTITDLINNGNLVADQAVVI